MVTNMPVWLTTYEPMAIDTIRHAAKRVKHALGRARGHWFTWTQLAAHMCQGNPATRVHLDRQGRIVVSAAEGTAAAYKHLCAVYDQRFAAAASLLLGQRGYRVLTAEYPLGLQLKPTFA
ncbi:hypothetical protein SDRG_09076 [Saprolegnia diclina VS20]|uniref:Uncharacterized protein n=1 Tax=Saprolegnia diclina (strain VS20) TaxID=1156394 RepID=T0QIM4_SAPDV|nr:hypothetical protein SDRG_09076 [Saprolegnia diclina VS20]EQC33570.1 hypothetical protein SDRG_09076 [Saprolegnia diclina VS20]|eukprot:XP_008613210.1 hypothetical protein SDRG_09076 [Saprolegnia diclina VS20]